MPATFDLFGFTHPDLDILVKLLEEILTAKFEPRNSLWFGDYYLYKDEPMRLKLVSNYNDYEEDWLDRDFKDHPSLLYVDNAPYPDDMMRLLDALKFENVGFAHLRRKII